MLGPTSVDRPRAMVMRNRALALMAVPLLLAACSSPVGPAGTSSPAASLPPSAAGAEERKITVGGIERYYLLFAPPSVEPTRPSPLVIYLHGAGGSAAASERETQLNVEAERQRFVVIYPQAVNPRIGNDPPQPPQWNAGCCSGAFDTNVDDVSFIQQLIERTSGDRSIDPDRIYVAGFSAGASLAYRIACERPERIAAIGAVSGGLLTAGCSFRSDVSILEIHGTNDRLVPYGGCSPTTTPCGPRGATMPPAEQMIARFRDLLACPTPSVERAGPVIKTTASPCRGGTEVTLIAAEGGVHMNPIGSATGASFATADIPALLKFLLAQRRPTTR